MSARTYFQELEFDLPSKLLEELVRLFGEMPAGPLNAEALGHVEEEQGVYQLFKDGQLVYIGKTDAEAGLKKRLSRHAAKIQSRRNLPVEQVTFKAIRVYVFTAMDLESLLISHYREAGQQPDWQHSGFGSNDPGKERDTTRVKETNFDAQYPIDLDFQVTIEADGNAITVAELLQQMKKQLAYNIRFETRRGGGRKPHQDLEDAEVQLPSKTGTVLSFLKLAKRELGASWRITALPGYVIAYKNDRRPIPSGTIIEAD
ncbi:GIY-YIG nuclease family protein [Billgrantia gudaonensis]|uniref:Eco29kI restriction endonuclease n=1 Tax=Billgrantia gudaonensis TaxID=376427 RepID=A0A1G8YLK6_9GAMM|nr:GIY-YIG nuclease family protein [Halomonas gudaonensis]SDK03651.1 Eco29kI restriction endonuclease [Halomonas gudaonensis]